jgi:RNA recognition motif-containing protein
MNYAVQGPASQAPAKFEYPFEEDEEQQEYSLFLSNVPSSINRESLREIFGDCGEISKIVLQQSFMNLNLLDQVGNNMKDNSTFGFAIISFRHVSSVFDALVELGEDDDFSLMGQKIR